MRKEDLRLSSKWGNCHSSILLFPFLVGAYTKPWLMWCCSISYLILSFSSHQTQYSLTNPPVASRLLHHTSFRLNGSMKNSDQLAYLLQPHQSSIQSTQLVGRIMSPRHRECNPTSVIIENPAIVRIHHQYLVSQELGTKQCTLELEDMGQLELTTEQEILLS